MGLTVLGLWLSVEFQWLVFGINVALFSISQVIMEIPLELMLTVSQKLPWMFFPDIVPVGHPIFDIINSTDPEVNVFYLISAIMDW